MIKVTRMSIITLQAWENRIVAYSDATLLGYHSIYAAFDCVLRTDAVVSLRS